MPLAVVAGQSRRAQVNEAGEEIVTSGCFTRAVMKRPCVVMWVTFVVAIILSALPLASGAISFQLTGAAGTDTDTIQEMRDHYTWVKIHDSGDKYQAPDAASIRRRQDLSTSIIYEGITGSNMFTKAAIDAQIEYEAALLGLPGWSARCKPATSAFNASDTRCESPQTVLRHLFRNGALEKAQCDAGFCAALGFGANASQALAQCEAQGYGVFPCTSTVYDWRDGTLAPEVDWPALLASQVCENAGMVYSKVLLLQTKAECTASRLSSRYVRSLYSVHDPLNTTWPPLEYLKANEVWVKTLTDKLDEEKGRLSATGVYATLTATSGTVNIWWDAPWITGSYYDLTGVLIASDLAMALFSLILIFLIILANTGSLLLTLAGLFEIFFSIPLAMFAWMLCGQSRIATFELLGLFLILCIGADDIFVWIDTWKESAFMPLTISGSLETRFSWTYNRAAGAMLTTTATTAFCLLLNAFSVFPMLIAFGVFNMWVVIADYLLVITWFACATVCLDRLTAKACPPGKNWECSCCRPGTVDAPYKERRSTAFFKNRLAPWTYKARWPLIVLSLGLLAGGIAVNVVMFKDGELKWFPPAHPLQKVSDIADDDFGPAVDYKVEVMLIYGMASPSISFPKSTNIYQAAGSDGFGEGYIDRFDLRFSPSFTFGPQQQLKMVADCEALRGNAEIVSGAEAYCLLNDLKAEAGSDFPYADEAALRAALEAFYASAAYAQLEARYAGQYAPRTGFLTDGERGIKALWNAFNTTIPTNLELSATAVSQYYNPWREAVSATCDDLVPCVMADWGYYQYMGMTFGLINTATLNIAIALIVSYIILLIFTGNFLAPVLAIVSIGSTITWVNAAILLMGYKFDLIGAILLVMIVGMSVDYAAHLTHFYNEAGGTRYEKAQGALHGVGLSVVGGALTTFCAAIPLLFTQIIFFKEMGFFILFTALFGLLFSFTLLVPLLMVLGPEGETGDVAPLLRRLKGQGGAPTRTAETPVSEKAPA